MSSPLVMKLYSLVHLRLAKPFIFLQIIVLHYSAWLKNVSQWNSIESIVYHVSKGLRIVNTVLNALYNDCKIWVLYRLDKNIMSDDKVNARWINT